jgi:signal transduction histidine kinase
MDQHLDFLAGGGEMGERIRAKDWSTTPLGAPDRWPQSLRSALSHLLPSKAQIVLFWGPELLTFYNDAYRPVLGGKHPKALGAPVREVWDELWENGLKDLFDPVLATGEAFWAQDRPFFLERHGYLEETYFDISYDPVRDESGRVGGVFCIVSETTGRVVGERRLRVLRDLGGIAQHASSVADVLAAAATILGRYPEDLPFVLFYSKMAKSRDDGSVQLASASGVEAGGPAAPRELASNEQASWPLVDALEIFDAGALPWPGALRAGLWPEAIRQIAVLPCSPVGESPTTWLVAGISPRRRADEAYRDFLRVVSSSIAAAVAVARRSEDERRRSQALAELDRAKTAFFSNVSHEFRTPLTLIAGPLEDVLHDAAEPLAVAQRERLDIARRSTQRLQKLVNTLLDFARIEAGRVQASYVPVDLAALTVDLVSSFRSAAERGGLALVVDCPPLPAPVYVDREMWEKIVLNLVSNAFKFTLEGSITVRLRRRGENAVLEVVDTGAGVAPSDLQRIFERFHRVEGVKSRTHEGTGIGLALVQELARMHGGCVTVESVHGRGSTFTVTIPFGSAHLPRDRVGAMSTLPPTAIGADPFVEEALGWLPGTPPTIPAPAEGTRPRIIWADDNRDMRDYVRRLLVGRYVVEAVIDGEEALAAARREEPDLVLSDVMMPRLDGLALTRAMRADPSLRDVPVMLLSARAGEEARVEALAEGADDYVVKPFSARELLARIESRLQIARLRSDALAAARKNEAVLRAVDRRKDEFIAMLSHELRNPLAPLRNGLHLLRVQKERAVDASRTHAMMERQLAHLVRLVDDLLEMSRINQGALELRRERLTLATLVGNAVETSEPLIREAGHRLDVEVPQVPVWIDGDPVRLGQVVSNLLNNAARYTERGGRISLRAELQPDRVAIAVRDTGIGFTPEAAAGFFELFQRGSRSKGLGIGLTIARRLAEMHGGTIRASSEGPGQGSCFTVELPLATAPAAPTAHKPRPDGLARQKILVVDDNEDAADSLGMLLEGFDSEVRVAHSGAEALTIFEGFEPTFVLLDIGMPVMDGYEVARAIRKRHPERRAVLVALTGWGQESDRRRARDAGFDHHLVKPPDLRRLQAILETPGPHPEVR